jgi:hypothetical protein
MDKAKEKISRPSGVGFFYDLLYMVTVNTTKPKTLMN